MTDVFFCRWRLPPGAVEKWGVPRILDFLRRIERPHCIVRASLAPSLCALRTEIILQSAMGLGKLALLMARVVVGTFQKLQSENLWRSSQAWGAAT